MPNVDAETDPRCHALLAAIAVRTGCPVLVDTSFDLRGERSVCTLADARRCLPRTDIDHLALRSFLLARCAQHVDADDARSWQRELRLD